MKVRLKTVIKVTAVIVVGLLATGIAVLKSMDFDQYRGLVAERVEVATGRKLDIGGHVDLRVLTLSPSLTVGDVSFANAPWGSRAQMITLERLEAEVALIPLFFGQVEVNRLVLVKPDIFLETDDQGRGNWQFVQATPREVKKPESVDGLGRLSAVQAVLIEDGRLVYRDGKTGESTTIGLTRLKTEAESATSPLAIELSGVYDGKPVALEGRLGALSELLRGGDPYRVEVTAEAGGATVRADGTVAGPGTDRGLALEVVASGDDLAELGAFIGTRLPAVADYRIGASVSGQGEVIRVARLEAVLGESDIAGEATVVPGPRPAVQASLSSRRLDLAALTAFPEDARADEPAAGEGDAPVRDIRLFSDKPLPLAGLKAVDADVTLKADNVVTQGPALSGLEIELALKDGRMAVILNSAGIAEGRATGGFTLDADSGGTAAVTARLAAEKVDLSAFSEGMGIEEQVSGKGSLKAALEGRGASLHEIMSTLSGETDVAVGEGHLAKTYMEILVADLARAAFGEGEPAKLNCAVSRFDIAQGVAVSRVMVVDTETVTIAGEGEIDLGRETIDLILVPEPKEVSLMNMAVPVRIEGSLASPSIYPDPAGVAKKAAAMLAGTMTGVTALGGLLAPLVASKATGAEQNPCLDLLGISAGPEPDAAEEEKGTGEWMMEGVGDTVRDIEKGLKGLFE